MQNAVLVQEQTEPFLFPEYDWEQRGFVDFTTVANTLVPFKGQWLLYYGGADRHVGLAVFSPNTPGFRGGVERREAGSKTFPFSSRWQRACPSVGG